MDSESESEREVTRVPTEADLVSLARELNRLGVAYVVIGGLPLIASVMFAQQRTLTCW
jgi:hypothetical protein